MSNNRKWLPTDYADECCPDPLVSPTAWVVMRKDGSWELAANDIADEPASVPLVEGQIVQFMWTEDFGSADLWYESDGTFSVDPEEPRAPAGGHMCVAFDGDPESVSDSVASLVESLRDMGESVGADTIHFFAWSSDSVPFVFRNGEFKPSDDGIAVREVA